MRPRFITFEGLDGSGKSTHVGRAARWLEEHGARVRTTYEPGGTRLGQAVRELFLDPQHAGMDGTVETLLLFASRRQHLREVIEPALAAGEHVLCDRFTDSTLAYQGCGRGVPLEVIRAADELATGGRRPDVTLLFDVPAELAHRRRGGATGDRLDAETLAFYERVRRGYLDLAEQEPGRFRVIRAAGELAATDAQVRAALADLVGPGDGG